jgi:predicted methyltransferase
MKTMMIAAAALLAVMAAQAPAAAQPPRSGQAAVDAARGDALTNPALKGPEVLAFMGVKPGDRIADLVAGRFTRALSRAVGPAGAVYAVEPAEVVAVHPQVMTLMNGLASGPGGGNVTVVTGPINTLILPNDLDIVLIRQNYHDMHDRFMGPADVAGLNRRIYAALKPGGVYVVLDHAAAAGSGLRDTDTLHRIDPAAVRQEVTAAGFVFDGESSILANPADPHDRNVFDPSIRGHTDQFLFRFRKPG